MLNFMTIINKINSKRVNRKNFIFYSGISLIGLYTMIKFPFRFFNKSNTYKENSTENKSGFIIKENPEAVKRNSEMAKK